LDDLISAVVNFEEAKVLENVKRRLSEHEDPKNVIEDLRKGMDKIGEKYAKGEYYLSELVMGGEIFRTAMLHIEPVLKGKAACLGSVVIGTVQGDIHDLGKNIFISLLKCAGFAVYDLGVDVPPEKFVDTVREVKPEIMAMSGILTVSRPAMKNTVTALREADLRDKVKVVIGGIFVDEDWRKDVCADAYSKDAYEGVEIAKKIVKAN
jgi:5-methyltetrahydrofolate--homocysteine methyltransferase